MRQRKTQEAESVLKQAIAANEDNPVLYLDLAALYISLKEYERADDALKAAMRLETQNPDLYITIGQPVCRHRKIGSG